MENTKDLIIFDLDSTITDIDVNYTSLVKLLNDKHEKNKIIKMNNEMNYINVFNYLYRKFNEKNISISTLQEELKTIKLAQGMEGLFSYLRSNKNKYYVCLLSGDNSFIVNNVLENSKIKDIFDLITCQKANVDFEKNLITVDFVEQNICKKCNPSQCKAEEMKLFKQKLGENNINRTMFVCDGYNDLCLARSLGNKDILFPRQNSSLYRKLFNDGIKEELICEICPWDNAEKIIDII